MSLKIFIILFLFSFVFTFVSHADEPVLKKIKNVEDADRILSGICMEKDSAKKEFTHESLRELEEEMKSGIDGISFPVLFSKYITDCISLSEHKRAKDFFLMLAEENQTSPHAMTAKGIVTYGWWAENGLRHGLNKIDEAISLDKKAFFPRLCRATYLSYLPEEFMASINEFHALLETERDNPSNLHDIYSNLIRTYGEHGHYDMAEQVNKTLEESQSHIHKKINYTNTSANPSGNIMYNSKIIKSPYPIMKSTNTNKATSPKYKYLNEDLAMLEKNMERRVNNKAFGDIYKRYILLTQQYGETDRAINFFDDLAERHPQSPNALAASGVITYGLRGQMLLQNGLDCIERAIALDNDNFFARINHATFIAYFPNAFIRSMYELSLLRQTEAGFHQRLSLINNRINLICSQHGHDRIPTEYKEPVINQRL